MPHDDRVDAYIAAAAPFAQPILTAARAALHRAAPGLSETIKWSRPFFDHDGSPVAYIAAFKNHCRIGFWRRGTTTPDGDDAGWQLASVADIPDDATLAATAAAAIGQIAGGVKTTRRAPPAVKAPLVVPPDLAAALDAVPAAAERFAAFPPGAQREYVAWITEAKAAATRAKRIGSTVEWTAEGKRRNWKYEAC